MTAPTELPKRRGRPPGSTMPADQRKDPVVRARVTLAQAEKFARIGGAEWLRKSIDRAKEP